MTRDDNWRLRAACATEDPELFFGPEQEHGRAKRIREEAAVTICARCPVAAMCLKDAVATRDAHGVRGGKTPEDIALMIRGDRGIPQGQPGPGRGRKPTGVKEVIVGLLNEGLTPIQIGERLGKAPGTIRTHIAEMRHSGMLPPTSKSPRGPGGRRSECGTYGGVRKHLRAGEAVCKRCKKAEAAYRTDLRHAARDRRREQVAELVRAGLTFEEIGERVGFNEMTIRRDANFLRAEGVLGERDGFAYQPSKDCGTARGWRLHRNARETPCKACDDAVAS